MGKNGRDPIPGGRWEKLLIFLLAPSRPRLPDRRTSSMKKLVIENLRNIAKLEFEFPWKRGTVFLLTGANGAGKSTLMTCLARIGDPGAFERYFRPNIFFSDHDADVFEDASIVYETEGMDPLIFRCRNGRWRPDDPVKMLEVFQSFQYPEVLYSGAFHRNEKIAEASFTRAAVSPAPERLGKEIREIFDDEKFSGLLTVPLGDAQVFLLRENIRGREYFFSENNFSLGERSVIRLVDSLLKAPPDSLALVDESEMALHPKAERRLFLCLEKICHEKNLTLLLSTHSASLIKTTSPKRLLFLENEGNGAFVCRMNVYPAAILGEMAIAEEILPETILLVEDAEAAMLLEAIINKLKAAVNADFPYCRILPVGGYMQVIILLDNLGKVFPPYVKRRAVLDRDAEPSVRRTAQDPHRSHFDVVRRNMERIYYLPCAPEQGVIRLLESDPKRHSRGLAEALDCPPLHLLDIMRGDGRYRAISGSSRAECKDKLSLIVDHLIMISGESEQSIRKRVYRYYVDNNYRNIEDLKQDYCSLIFRR